MKSPMPKVRVQKTGSAGVYVIGLYTCLQAVYLLNLNTEFAFLFTVAFIVIGIGLIKLNKTAYFAAIVSYSITFLYSLLVITSWHLLGYGIIWPYPAVSFWSSVIIAGLLLPGIRNQYFVSGDYNQEKLEKKPSLENSFKKPIRDNANTFIKEPTFIWPTGAKYYGEHKNGKRHGMGETKYPNGIKYKGEYKADKRHGNGMIIYEDGRIEKGYWEDGVKIN